MTTAMVSNKPEGKCPVTIKQSKTSSTGQFSLNIPTDQYLNVLKELTATQDDELAEDICRQAVGAMPSSDGAHEINTILQTLADFEPKDAVEARLCLQSHVLYAQGMEYLSKAGTAKTAPISQMFMNFAIKLLRLHNETIETLNRHRRKGEQKVIVQHVNVENGGKAIVGNLFTDGERGGR